MTSLGVRNELRVSYESSLSTSKLGTRHEHPSIFDLEHVTVPHIQRGIFYIQKQGIGKYRWEVRKSSPGFSLKADFIGTVLFKKFCPF